ncbi:hypothetical protein P2G88_18700 [Aliiglaciecola sp. CAU 1673]|uniref:hypothetical protein n=1 Tax=Aliiglaciecola sp. CAU 1673 TaxID=3032595 RepID=UPI0023DB6844|nr:hypothetical protein [Aliiglaciecola sp. CAU 1673]MDF2180291.1 hypothetical protein [Aliiglaciecola sp. CAU 1673]
MKKSVLALSALFPLLLGGCMSATASEPATASDYKVQSFKDCQLVSEFVMTDEQRQAYQELMETEKKMEQLQAPIDAIEEQLDQYAADVERLTKLAIEETDQGVYINKAHLSEQKVASQKLNALIAAHQQDFDALGAYGKVISDKAERFKQSLDAQLKNADFDQLHIKGPGEQSHRCYASNEDAS